MSSSSSSSNSNNSISNSSSKTGSGRNQSNNSNKSNTTTYMPSPNVSSRNDQLKLDLPVLIRDKSHNAHRSSPIINKIINKPTRQQRRYNSNIYLPTHNSNVRPSKKQTRQAFHKLLQLVMPGEDPCRMLTTWTANRTR